MSLFAFRQPAWPRPRLAARLRGGLMAGAALVGGLPGTALAVGDGPGCNPVLFPRPCSPVCTSPTCRHAPAPPPPQPVYGDLLPKYFVITVIYAPPGTQGGKSASSVTYASSSTTGTTTTVAHSFQQDYALELDNAVSFGATGEANLSFTYGVSNTDTHAFEISKSASAKIEYQGNSKDGIDHDRDQIYLWLNPAIRVGITPAASLLAFTGSEPMDIQYLYVGQLNGHTPPSPGVMQALQRYGITAADFPDILKHDPLADGSATFDPARFAPLGTTIPYTPPFAAADPVPVITYSVSSGQTASSTQKTEDSYKVGLKISAGADFLGLAKSKLVNTDSWEWTNTVSLTNTGGASESASVSIGGPSFGWTGSTDLAVYYDRIYKTFAFRLLDAAPLAVAGMLRGKDGQPVAAAEVSMVANGVRLGTFTNAKGEFRFTGPVSGAATITAGSVSQTLPRTGNVTGVVLQQH